MNTKIINLYTIVPFKFTFFGKLPYFITPLLLYIATLNKLEFPHNGQNNLFVSLIILN